VIAGGPVEAPPCDDHRNLVLASLTLFELRQTPLCIQFFLLVGNNHLRREQMLP